MLKRLTIARGELPVRSWASGCPLERVQSFAVGSVQEEGVRLL